MKPTSQTSWWAGFSHVRSLPLTAAVVGVLVILVGGLNEVSLTIQPDPRSPPRGVGAIELATILAAMLLPPLLIPRFDRRERVAGPRARWTAAATVLTYLAVPLVLLAVWTVAVRLTGNGDGMPPTTGLVGTLVGYAAIGIVLTLLVGPVLGPLTTLGAVLSFLYAQQLRPDGWLAQHFATGAEWRTDWTVTALLAAGALAAGWATRGLPLVRWP